MNITSQITIARPREQVIELITNPAHTPQWQPGIKRIDLLSGRQDEVGARSRVIFEFNGYQMEVIETVVKRSPPVLFSSSFEARGVKNTVVNRFYAVGPQETHWVMDNTFQFGGAMAFAGVFVRNFIAKQTVQSMNRFKLFAEKT